MVLEICRELGIAAAERDLRPGELLGADEVFCSGTMGELAAVTEVDGRSIGSGEPGAMTARLTAAYARRTASEGTRLVD